MECRQSGSAPGSWGSVDEAQRWHAVCLLGALFIGEGDGKCYAFKRMGGSVLFLAFRLEVWAARVGCQLVQHAPSDRPRACAHAVGFLFVVGLYVVSRCRWPVTFGLWPRLRLPRIPYAEVRRACFCCLLGAAWHFLGLALPSPLYVRLLCCTTTHTLKHSQTQPHRRWPREQSFCA